MAENSRAVWIADLPGTLGPIALQREDFPQSYVDAGWIVEGPMASPSTGVQMARYKAALEVIAKPGVSEELARAVALAALDPSLPSRDQQEPTT